MEISKEILQGLTYLGNTSYVTDDNFKRIVKSCFGLLLGDPTIERVSNICPEKGNTIKEVYSSLLTFIIVSIQGEAEEEIIKEILEKQKFKSIRIEQIVKALNDNRTDIRQSLENCHSTWPNVVDVNWRLDFVLKSNVQNHIGEPLYYIVLTTEKEGKLDYIKFTCNLHQLQDLSTKLKEIVSHLDKLSST